jgi:hypothetical protein
MDRGKKILVYEYLVRMLSLCVLRLAVLRRQVKTGESSQPSGAGLCVGVTAGGSADSLTLGSL